MRIGVVSDTHNQLRNVFRKLDVCTRAELVRVVMSQGDE